MSKNIPALFGIKNSNRDFSRKDSWSKNKFNSSFPAALIAYMGSKNIKCVYLKLSSSGKVIKDYISAQELFQTDPLGDDLYYWFETEFTPFKQYSIGTPPRVDLMLSNRAKTKIYSGYEVKLTTLPDESTCNLNEDQYGSELVVRMPSIQFLACSISSIYNGKFDGLKKYFGKNGFGNVSSYMEAAQVNPRLGDIYKRLNDLIYDNIALQKPIMIQPIWKTLGKSARLADDCLDVFVWSDFAFTRLFMNDIDLQPKDLTQSVNRPTRALIQLFFMLNEVSMKGCFHANDILQKLTYTKKNDKAFSVPGRKTNEIMKCVELHHPRIKKSEIKNIILGDGRNYLSPERRFDAALVSSNEIFV